MSIHLQKIETTFYEVAQASVRKQQEAYMRHQFVFVGLKTPLRRSLQKQVFQQWPGQIEEVIHLLKLLWKKKEREFQYAALDWAKYHWKLLAQSSQVIELFESMIREKSWWDTVDDLAINLVGKLLRMHPSYRQCMDHWITDDHMWIRRSAIIHQNSWKNATDSKKLFNYCSITMHEKDFFIRKAIGWALREYSKSHGEAVKSFILINQKSLSGLSIRESCKYLNF